LTSDTIEAGMEYNTQVYSNAVRPIQALKSANVLKEAEQAKRNLNVTRTAIKFRQISYLGSRSNIEEQQLQRARDKSILSTSGPGGLEEVHAQQVVEAEIAIGKVAARNAINALRAGLWHRHPVAEVAEAASHLEATRIHLLELAEHRAELETEDLDLQFLHTEIANISAEALAYIKENTPVPMTTRPLAQATTSAASQPPPRVPVASRPPVGTQPPAIARVTVQPPSHFQLPVMNAPPPNNAAYMTPQPGSSGTQPQRPVSTHNLTMHQAFNVGEVVDDVGNRSLNDTPQETNYGQENHDPNATFRPDHSASLVPGLNETVRPDPNATFRPEDHQTETLDTMVANHDLTIRQLIPNPELARGTMETVISAPNNMARGACVSSIYTPYRDSGAVRPPLPGIPAGSFATPTGIPMHAPNITMTPMLRGAAPTGLASWAPSQATVSH
jgi:hypothetical protein